MTTITINLPDHTLKQAHQAAATLQKPVEEVLRDMLVAVLPADQDVPTDLQVELTKMTWLDNQSLWEIATSELSEQAQTEFAKLSRLQSDQALEEEEVLKLEQLRQEYGRITLKKARAYALLSLRGGKPLLN